MRIMPIRTCCEACDSSYAIDSDEFTIIYRHSGPIVAMHYCPVCTLPVFNEIHSRQQAVNLKQAGATVKHELSHPLSDAEITKFCRMLNKIHRLAAIAKT